MQRIPDIPGVEVAVVLGGGLLDDGSLGPRVHARVTAAAELAKKYPKMLFVLSGGKGAKQNPALNITEAEAMSRFLQDKGISGNRLLLEDESIDTNGNVVLTVLRYLQSLEAVRKVYVVSSPIHMPRVTKIFRHILGKSWDVVGCPSAVAEGDDQLIVWETTFFDGTPEGDLPAAVKTLLEHPEGKAQYRTHRRLQDCLKKAS